MWKYDSPIGTLYIKPLKDGTYGFLYGGIIWESCPTPQAEADNIYLHCTGCFAWDCLEGRVSNVPTSLAEWEKL